jgi:predicted nuclease with TOPRIM domain
VSEISKYEAILNDLTQIESEVAIIVEKLKLTSESLKEKEMQLAILKQENQQLHKRISELEYELNNAKITSQNNVYKPNEIVINEEIKEKIKNLISKIDFHLSS